jgi:hypothetical protein
VSTIRCRRHCVGELAGANDGTQTQPQHKIQNTFTLDDCIVGNSNLCLTFFFVFFFFFRFLIVIDANDESSDFGSIGRKIANVCMECSKRNVRMKLKLKNFNKFHVNFFFFFFFFRFPFAVGVFLLSRIE